MRLLPRRIRKKLWKMDTRYRVTLRDDPRIGVWSMLLLRQHP
ncbi:MAG: hypothetical protein OEV12_01200 [Gammaproteobacteria bacterium]|nr:hypothetical protein [Gammaproteobacteria bacterium]MDH3970552.1 hypothetical protein [Gammaproteobacteria bacterium]MDH3985013.1 hypothetical protein [Gammaproteobacteria bacterium]